MQSFDIKQHAELGKFIGTKLDGAIRKGLLSAALRVVSEIQTVIIPGESREPVLRGVYKAGWKATKTPNGAEVYNDVPYAGIIEYGVPAGNVKIGRAMLAALAEWARMKGLVAKKKAVPGASSQFVTKVSYRSKSNQEVADDAKNIAWAIAKGIKKRGLFNGGRGLRILERAMEKVPEFVQEEVVREIKEMGG